MNLLFPSLIIQERLRSLVVSVVAAELFSAVAASEALWANEAAGEASRERVWDEVASPGRIDIMTTVVDEVDVVVGLGGKITTSHSAIVTVRLPSDQTGH